MDEEEPKTIDLKPTEHSSSYEIKPHPRKDVLMLLAFAVFGLLVLYPTDMIVWCIFIFGIVCGIGLVITFPKTWLSKRDD